MNIVNFQNFVKYLHKNKFVNLQSSATTGILYLKHPNIENSFTDLQNKLAADAETFGFKVVKVEAVTVGLFDYGIKLILVNKE